MFTTDKRHARVLNRFQMTTESNCNHLAPFYPVKIEAGRRPGGGTALRRFPLLRLGLSIQGDAPLRTVGRSVRASANSGRGTGPRRGRGQGSSMSVDEVADGPRWPEGEGGRAGSRERSAGAPRRPHVTERARAQSYNPLIPSISKRVENTTKFVLLLFYIFGC